MACDRGQIPHHPRGTGGVAVRTKAKPRKIVKHVRQGPVIRQYSIVEYPPCMASVSSPETVRYRLHVVRNHYEAREDDKGLPILQCGHTATYQIGDEWYCRKHAALIALDMIAVPVGVTP